MSITIEQEYLPLSGFFKSTNGTDFLETFYRYDRRQI